MKIKRSMGKGLGIITVLAILLILVPVNALAEDLQLGCTVPYGYWKTHSIYGPAHYDETWAQIGEDGENTTPFFNSLYSWYQVTKIQPKGNPYFILSKQYVAAQLNILAGAGSLDITPPNNYLGEATVLLDEYTPSFNWNPDQDGVRDEFINLATTLANYNEGLIGPGLCD